MKDSPIPVVEETTPEIRLNTIVADLNQLAKEYAELPLATWCLEAVQAIQQGRLRAKRWVKPDDR